MMVIQGVNGQRFGQYNGFGAGRSNGFGRSYGLGAALVANVDYACGKTICYAKGKDNHAKLMALQDVLNRFAAKAGFAPLFVDGFIGDLTVTAANKVLGTAFSRETLTQSAEKVTGDLEMLALSSELPAVAAPVAPTKPKPAAVAQEEASARASAAAPTREAAPSAKSGKWIWWTLGFVAVVGAGTVGYMTWKRRKGEHAMAPAMAGYHGYYR